MTEEDRLLAGIYAAPGDDALRAAYAACLTARGAPLGRFIEAQLRQDADAARAHLPAAIAATPLPMLGTPPLEAFSRGFLSTGFTRGALALPSAAHDGWRLIEHLRLLEPQAADFVAAAGPRLCGLKTFETERGDAVEALARACPRPLERLRAQLDSWFDLGPLLDQGTVLDLGIAGVFVVGRDPGRVFLSPSASLPFREDLVEPVLRTIVRPDDQIDFAFMGDRTAVDAVRRALAGIPHRSFTEAPLVVLGQHRWTEP